MSSDLILEYLRATTNLYGMIPPDKVVEIYNQQNDPPIDVRDLEPYMDIDNEYFVFFEDHFIHEALFVKDDSFAELKAQQGKKPYYVPDKAELLNYAEDMYVEKPPERQKLYQYILDHLISDPTKAEELTEDIHLNCSLGGSIPDILDEFTRRDVSFEGIDQLNEILPLITGLANNTRIWENRGHTPNELAQKFDRAGRRPLTTGGFPSMAPWSQAVDMPRMKKERPVKVRVGRNDPCPCGSGKKYKKCCLEKEQ